MSRLRLGQVGGGDGAFIGAVHRMAARLDDRYELVAGCFGSTPERSKASAGPLNVPPERTYGDFREMAAREAERADGIDVVSIVTPNHMHYPVAREFLRRGIHVICDKPLTSELEDARRLHAVAQTAREEHGTRFFITYNYSGYPMVRQARAIVAAGDIGALRVVRSKYAQDWLSRDVENEGLKQAAWRTDPAKAGGGGSIGDIGTHAFHLAAFVSGEHPDALLADLTAFVDGRALDDNAHILLRYPSGARGSLWCSQVAPGHENDLRLQLHGSKGSLEWHQEHPNALRFTPLGEATRTITRGGAGAGDAANDVSRVPAGHPEGYLEGFANLYRQIADALTNDDTAPLPDIDDGLRGMTFIDAALLSAALNNVWISL